MPWGFTVFLKLFGSPGGGSADPPGARLFAKRRARDTGNLHDLSSVEERARPTRAPRDLRRF